MRSFDHFHAAVHTWLWWLKVAVKDRSYCGVSTQLQLHPGIGPQSLSVLLRLLLGPSWSGFQYLVSVKVWWDGVRELCDESQFSEPFQSNSHETSPPNQLPDYAHLPTWLWSASCMLWTYHLSMPPSTGPQSFSCLPPSSYGGPPSTMAPDSPHHPLTKVSLSASLF